MAYSIKRTLPVVGNVRFTFCWFFEDPFMTLIRCNLPHQPVQTNSPNQTPYSPLYNSLLSMLPQDWREGRQRIETTTKKKKNTYPVPTLLHNYIIEWTSCWRLFWQDLHHQSLPDNPQLFLDRIHLPTSTFFTKFDRQKITSISKIAKTQTT